MRYDICASIVLYNTNVDEITHVLDILHKSPLKIKIFLIDNSPTDSIKDAFAKYVKAEYIFTGKNLGFGSGHNIAINKARDISEFHLILNADVDFDYSILEEMYAYMKAHEEVGLSGPKVLNPDGTIQYSAKLLPTPLDLIIRRFVPFKSIRDKIDYNYELKFSDFSKVVEIPFLMGCFLLINSKVFKKIGGFDERFFMYIEDIDLTRRIHNNHKTIYYPSVSISHIHGKESYSNYSLMISHMISAIKYFNKWGWFFDKERKEINAKIRNQFLSTH